jgi:hypothetical protein
VATAVAVAAVAVVVMVAVAVAVAAAAAVVVVVVAMVVAGWYNHRQILIELETWHKELLDSVGNSPIVYKYHRMTLVCELHSMIIIKKKKMVVLPGNGMMIHCFSYIIPCVPTFAERFVLFLVTKFMNS